MRHGRHPSPPRCSPTAREAGGPGRVIQSGCSRGNRDLAWRTGQSCRWDRRAPGFAYWPILSSGFTWAVGQRSFEGANCTGLEYIAFGAGSSAGGTRLTVVYREGSQYMLAVSKPAAGNLSRRAFQSYVDQLGRCQPSSATLVAIDVERRISLERFGSPPFFGDEVVLMSASDGGFNWSMQHATLRKQKECGCGEDQEPSTRRLRKR